MKAKIYLDEIKELTHDQLASRAHRMAAANDLPDLMALAVELRDAVDNEQSSEVITEQIRQFLVGLGINEPPLHR
jgi:hypothetical protein